MNKVISIAHFSSITAFEGRAPSPDKLNNDIETVFFNEQQYDLFVKEFWKQSDFLINKGYQPKQVIISLEEYKNLLAFEQTTKVEQFLGLPIVVDRFANKPIKVLPSPEDQMALYHFIKQEVGQD